MLYVYLKGLSEINAYIWKESKKKAISRMCACVCVWVGVRAEWKAQVNPGI